ncbi:hypothetical protein J5N97_025479 [Dioscorea zingiberensis]|uniref:Large ribosomal subunit protein uL6 alpha-beta domain-containing protein n=1 Tax=Dioscorea zingiberensis TaxID=325984 RepID=A0A9D5C9J3_9LILI|nr:hypothetical protein J5N97_025479 [Dioscorea zingiberensis]
MKTIRSSQTMDILKRVKVRVKAKLIEVEGPRGKLTRNFKHLNLDFELIDGGRKLKVHAWFGSRKIMAAIRTALSHVKNLITGVTKRDIPSRCASSMPTSPSIPASPTVVQLLRSATFLAKRRMMMGWRRKKG